MNWRPYALLVALAVVGASCLGFYLFHKEKPTPFVVQTLAQAKVEAAVVKEAVAVQVTVARRMAPRAVKIEQLAQAITEVTLPSDPGLPLKDSTGAEVTVVAVVTEAKQLAVESRDQAADFEAFKASVEKANAAQILVDHDKDIAIRELQRQAALPKLTPTKVGVIAVVAVVVTLLIKR